MITNQDAFQRLEIIRAAAAVYEGLCGLSARLDSESEAEVILYWKVCVRSVVTTVMYDLIENLGVVPEPELVNYKNTPSA